MLLITGILETHKEEYIMMNKIIAAYMALGCWFGGYAVPALNVAYTIWLVLVIFWIAVNAISLIPGNLDNVRAEMMKGGRIQSVVIGWGFFCLLSFVLCGETMIALFFGVTVIPVMFLFVHIQKDLEKKKKKS